MQTSQWPTVVRPAGSSTARGIVGLAGGIALAAALALGIAVTAPKATTAPAVAPAGVGSSAGLLEQRRGEQAAGRVTSAGRTHFAR